MEESDNPYTPLLQAIQSPFLSKPLSVAVKSVLAGINIANIVLGSVYINGCPGQRLIPYYLIVLGVGSLLLLSLTCLPCGDGRDPPRTTLGLLCAQGALALFLFAFFIAGNVWIYSLYSEPWDSAGDPKWCNRILYLYAFWITTFFHMCFLLIIIAFLCLFICLCVLKSSLSSRSQTD
ncbi:transmembrane protein 272-like [Spea bombifrons]|uniref:transmembrane protein 272-like n=1 Tax=Spea bombifrons TaxID=233779 RepID=UPI0023497D07|nr:transmembrane protein 272-like [Spea bombifrons]XP_053318873.1 transmembrane protein 272-like [Spea bombifrons]